MATNPMPTSLTPALQQPPGSGRSTLHGRASSFCGVPLFGVRGPAWGDDISSDPGGRPARSCERASRQRPTTFFPR
jgi:hypothetical protein